jgi:hypothetical protein
MKHTKADKRDHRQARSSGLQMQTRASGSFALQIEVTWFRPCREVRFSIRIWLALAMVGIKSQGEFLYHGFFEGEQRGLNPRPPDPQSGALTN